MRRQISNYFFNSLLESAVRFYIEREGDLPTIDYGDELDLA